MEASGHQALPDSSEYSIRPTAWEHEVLEDFPAFLINLLGVVEIRYELDVTLSQSRHFAGLTITYGSPERWGNRPAQLVDS